MSDVTIEVPQAVADELNRQARSEGKSPAALLREVLGLRAQDPFEFVGSFASKTIVARDVDEKLVEFGFGNEG